jgi:hypothetical protein
MIRVTALAAVLLMCSDHVARADRAVRCTEAPNSFHTKTDEITIQQREGGYEINGNPAKVIFESTDRRKAVLYVLPGEWWSLVRIVTVDFQISKVVTYEPPVGVGEPLENPRRFEGCQRLD